jgi:hypothetical protein
MAKRLTPTVKCEVCYNKYRSLAGHLKTHGLNVKTYRVQFNDAPTISTLTRRRLQLARLRYILRKKGAVAPQTARGLKISLANKGRRHSPETIEKIRKSRQGVNLSEEHKLAISAGLLGHKVSDATKEKLSKVVFTEERRRNISDSQSAEKSNSWKGGRSRHLYFGRGKFRLKKIFGDPLKCYFPDCDKVEGDNVKSLDCHHVDGNHENNPLDGSNWLPLCRRHHMLADGRLRGADAEQIADAQSKALAAHKKHMETGYIGEIKSYHS